MLTRPDFQTLAENMRKSRLIMEQLGQKEEWFQGWEHALNWLCRGLEAVNPKFDMVKFKKEVDKA